MSTTSTDQKYYFFKSSMDMGQARYKCLPKQNFSGREVSAKLNAMPPSSYLTPEVMRASIGSIFACESIKVPGVLIEIKSSFFPVICDNIPQDELVQAGVPIEAILAAKEHLTKLGLGEEPKEEDENAAPKPKPLIHRLRKQFALPTIDTNGFYVDEDMYYLLLRNIKKRENTMLVGPTGCGKTEIIQLLAGQVEKELIIKDMGAMHDPISGLLGTHRIRQGQSAFDYASFVHEIQRGDVMIDLDELSRAPATTNNILFPVLDGRRTLYIDIADDAGVREVKVHEDVTFFATANLGGQYTGVTELDRALKDRFTIVELDYLPSDVETRLLTKRTGIDKRGAEMIVGFMHKIRQLYRASQVSDAPSTRESLRIAELVEDGMSLPMSMRFTLYPMYEGNETEGERSVIHSLITSK